MVETNPDCDIDGVVRWRSADLHRILEKRFGVA